VQVTRPDLLGLRDARVAASPAASPAVAA